MSCDPHAGHAQTAIRPHHQHQLQRRVMGFKHCGAYAVSKFGVEDLSLSVAREVEQFGIKVAIVVTGGDPLGGMPA